MRLSRRFKCFPLFSDKLPSNNCVRLTAYLQLHIYENLYSNLNYVFSSLFRWGRKNRGLGRGRGQLNEKPIDIQKLNYQNYVNPQIILAAVKLTNSEKQVSDSGRRSEERCIVLIDTDQT